MLSTVTLARIEFYRTIKPTIPGETSGWLENDVGYLGECVNGLIGLYSGGAASNEWLFSPTCLVFYEHSERSRINMVVISWLLLLIGVVESFATEWNTQDYMKREHSLIRPYQGPLIVIYLSSRSLDNPKICLFIYYLIAICGDYIWRYIYEMTN